MVPTDMKPGESQLGAVLQMLDFFVAALLNNDTRASGWARTWVERSG
jgi:hypothetical protein